MSSSEREAEDTGRAPHGADPSDLCPCQEAAIQAIVAASDPYRTTLAALHAAATARDVVPIRLRERPGMRLRRPPDEAKALQGTITDGLGALTRDGLAESWEADRGGAPVPGGPFVTLTPAGARRASVALVEEYDEHPVWRGGDGRPEGPVRNPHGVHPRAVPLPKELADKRPGPAEEAERNELYVMQEKTRADGRPDIDLDTGEVRRVPVLLLGRLMAIDRKLRGKKKGGGRAKAKGVLAGRVKAKGSRK